jgi:hypothetical protein
LSTKVGRLLRPIPQPAAGLERRHPLPFDVVYDYSHDGIRRSFEASLQRLGLARIDILYVHDIGVSIVVGGPFDSGILAGRDTWNYDTAPPEIAARAKTIDAVSNGTACRCRPRPCVFRWPTSRRGGHPGPARRRGVRRQPEAAAAPDPASPVGRSARREIVAPGRADPALIIPLMFLYQPN